MGLSRLRAVVSREYTCALPRGGRNTVEEGISHSPCVTRPRFTGARTGPRLRRNARLLYRRYVQRDSLARVYILQLISFAIARKVSSVLRISERNL